MDKADELAKKIWDYMNISQTPEKADVIVVFGSRDMGPAYHACDLYFQGYAPFMVFSGNHGPEHSLPKPEATLYAEVAEEKDVPKSAVLIEKKSLNTGENIKFSKKLIEESNILCKKVILLHKPYMLRRAYASIKKQWPELEVITSSENISFQEYINSNKYDTKERIICRMVGDLERIREYPKLGFQVEQEIPLDVWEAGKELIKMGYDKYTLK